MACAAPAAPIASAAKAPPKGVWVIYLEARWPQRFVARKFLCGKVFIFTTDEELAAETLIEVRALLPAGLVNVGRNEEDPRNVVETWA